eukprot:6180140-Pleurochrysis_carterae.AAC.3
MLGTVTDPRRFKSFGASPRGTSLAPRTVSSPAPAQQNLTPAHNPRERQSTNTTELEAFSGRQ